MQPHKRTAGELTDSDVAFIKDAPLEELQHELYYARGRDAVYARALAAEILRRGAMPKPEAD